MLQRYTGALDAIFGGRRIGTDVLDSQLKEPPCEPRVPRVSGRGREKGLSAIER
jgi:hypothetical protein